jgi:hypothetical protein
MYKAGCERTWEIASDEPDLAYTDQAFPECPACLHRVEPQAAQPERAQPQRVQPFCTLRPLNTPHPFAGLAGLLGELD